MSAFQLAALDLDGTLVDSAPDLSHCLGVALGSVGLPPPSLADTRRWIGDGVTTLVRRGLTAGLNAPPGDDVLRGALGIFKDTYAENLFVLSSLYPGVAATLSALRSAGIVMGCVTNKPAAFAESLLEQAGIGSMFDFVYGGDTFPAMKPDPEPLNQATRRFGIPPAGCVMVGDSANDREAACRAGFRFVLASYGYLPSGDAFLEPEDMRIGAFSELPQLLCGQ